MGTSASSLLDDTRSDHIKGQAEAKLKEFSPYYRKQFSVARFSEVEDDLEQHKEKITQLLKQREAPEEAEVLYEDCVFYFDETRKWRDRYVVVRANYCLECHDSLETFIKGVPPRQKLLPTGGAVLTTEEKYMVMVDKCFPDDTNVKEDFAPPISGMPGQFPVYLRLPYRRDSYFCFKQQAKQAAFLSILSDCIRHQNQDFLKKKTCEVQAFLKAIQLYRQDKGQYEAWDMLIGSDVRVLSNLVMEELLPSLEKDFLPRLKAKKTERKRVWFATVEAVYILVQEFLLHGLTALKDECRASLRQQEVQIHSDIDLIISTRQQLEQRITGRVLGHAEKLCSERVQPYLGSVLEELMEPISSGFQEGRQLINNSIDQVCQDGNEQLKKSLSGLSGLSLLRCYGNVAALQDKSQPLKLRFDFSDITTVIHSAQIDLQQLIENAAYTFEQLLLKAVQDNPDNASTAIEKVKHRVLKQYDYDSSSVRKRISREALVSITLPFIKKNLEPTCRTELQGLETLMDGDHSNFIHVENVYESILLQTLDKEVTKVVKEAASLKKYNLFMDSRDLLSQSSLSSTTVSIPGSPATPTFSIPGSPATPPVSRCPATPAVSASRESPPALNGLSSPQKMEGALPGDRASAEAVVMETPLGKVGPKEVEEEEEPKAGDGGGQNVTTETGDDGGRNVTTVAPETAGVEEAVVMETPLGRVEQKEAEEEPKAGDDGQSVTAEAGGDDAPVAKATADVVEAVATETPLGEAEQSAVSQEEEPKTGNDGQNVTTEAGDDAPVALATADVAEAVATVTPLGEAEQKEAEQSAGAVSEEEPEAGNDAPVAAETAAVVEAVAVETPLGKVEKKEASGSVVSEEEEEEEEEEPKTGNDTENVTTEPGNDAPVAPETAGDSTNENAERETGEKGAEEAGIVLSEIIPEVENVQIEEEEEVEEEETAQTEVPVATNEEETLCGGSESKSEAPSGGEKPENVVFDPRFPKESPEGKDEVSVTSDLQETPPLDSIKEIRDLVVEVFEVEELVQRYPKEE